MPYKIRKQNCQRSDGEGGNYVLAYTDKKGKRHSNCHISKKNAQNQIGAIEASLDENEHGEEMLDEIKVLRYLVRNCLLEVMQDLYSMGLEDGQQGKQPELNDDKYMQGYHQGLAGFKQGEKEYVPYSFQPTD